MSALTNENTQAVQGLGVGSFTQAISKALPVHPITEPRIFGFDGAPIRVVHLNTAPWFVAADVCGALGIKWKGAGKTGTLAPLDEDEKAQTDIRTQGGLQQVAIVSESGLYALTLRSQGATKPGSSAHRFRKWVTADVLPQLRQTGAYSTAPTLPNFANPAAAARAWADEHEARAASEAKVLTLAHQVNRQAEVIEYQRPAADFVAKYVDSTGTRSIREVAKQLGAKEGEFIHWLEDTGVLFRHHEHGRLLPKAEHQHAGRFVMKVGVSDEGKMWSQARFTARGVAWIAARWEKKKAADADGGGP